MTSRPPKPGQLLREAKAELVEPIKYSFTPTAAMQRAKARFELAMDEHADLVDAESLTMDLIAGFAGTESVRRWCQDNPDFLGYLLDRDYLAVRKRILREKAINTIEEIMEDDMTKSADRLKAADMALQLDEAYPAKRTEVRWADRELEQMDEADVARKTKELQAKLGKLPPGP